MALKRPPPPPGGELRPCLISGNGREKKSGRGKRGKEGEDGGRIGERMGKGGGTSEIWLRLGENLVGARVEGIVGREDEGAGRGGSSLPERCRREGHGGERGVAGQRAGHTVDRAWLASHWLQVWSGVGRQVRGQRTRVGGVENWRASVSLLNFHLAASRVEEARLEQGLLPRVHSRGLLPARVSSSSSLHG